MNRLEKDSFFSFLLLYLMSSLVFLSISAYWYFNTQKLSIETLHYYKMQHFIDKVNERIIVAHMKKKTFSFTRALTQEAEKEAYEVAFFNKNKQRIGGVIALDNEDFNHTYYQRDNKKILISKGSYDHLGIHYVVLSTDALPVLIQSLTIKVFIIGLLAFVLVCIIGWSLSKMFLMPIRQKMDEIEHFIKDISHELNTPITALMLSSKRLKDKALYDEKIVRNISISTKQLFDMYNALAFTNFSQTGYRDEMLSFSKLVSESTAYFDELLQSKKITLKSNISDKELLIDPQKAKMLINNILSNAIKYSMPNSEILVDLDTSKLVIKDQGIGIDEDKLESIFKRFTRASDYSGGFGVGLSVVKHICDDYGFKVKVHSVIDEGTSVEIIF